MVNDMEYVFVLLHTYICNFRFA